MYVAIRPMKLDLQFLAQNSGKMMWTGRQAVIIHYLLQLKTVKIA